MFEFEGYDRTQCAGQDVYNRHVFCGKRPYVHLDGSAD